jgi:hypothetical protein
VIGNFDDGDLMPHHRLVRVPLPASAAAGFKTLVQAHRPSRLFERVSAHCQIGLARPAADLPVAGALQPGAYVANDFFLVRAHLFHLIASHVGALLGDALAYEVARAILSLGAKCKDGLLPKVARVGEHKLMAQLRADPGLFPRDARDVPLGVGLCKDVLRGMMHVCAELVSYRGANVDRIVCFDVEKALIRLREDAVAHLVGESQGAAAKLVFGMLKIRGAMEEGAVCGAMLDTQENSRAALYRLHAAGLVQCQEVPRRNEFHPGSMCVLWSASSPLALFRFGLLVQKQVLNIDLRDEWVEEESAQVRLDKARDDLQQQQQHQEQDVPGPEEEQLNEEVTVVVKKQAPPELPIDVDQPKSEFEQYTEMHERLMAIKRDSWDALLLLSDLGFWTRQGFGSIDAALGRDVVYSQGTNLLPRGAEESDFSEEE